MNDLLEILEWDTRFFGFGIARITAERLYQADVESILLSAKKRGIRLLYFIASPDDYETIQLVEQSQFHLVDIRLLLEHPYDARPVPSPRFPPLHTISLHAPADKELPALESIAIEIGFTSRFCFDRSFPPDACPRLYRAWIHKLLGDGRTRVTVAYRADEPIGLLACNINKNVGMIELAGVSSGARGSGVGTALVQNALDWFRDQGVPRAEVVTQGRNVPAQRIYQQMGFFTRQIMLYYHKWL